MTKKELISITILVLLVGVLLGAYFVKDVKEKRERNEYSTKLTNSIYIDCLYIKGDFSYNDKKVEMSNERYDERQLMIDVAFYNYYTGSEITTETLYQEYENFRKGKNSTSYQALETYVEYMSDRQVDIGMFEGGLYRLIPNGVIIYDLTLDQLNDYIKEYLSILDVKIISKQMGNYVNGGISVKDEIYLIEAADEGTIGGSKIFKIDTEGNFQDFFDAGNLAEDGAFIKDYLFYYDGCFYVKCVFVNQDKDNKILRISEDGKNVDVIYETNKKLLFGISEDYMYISDGEITYYIYASQLDDFSRLKYKKTESHTQDKYNNFFCEWIYNNKIISPASGETEYDTEERQYYGNYAYLTKYTEDLTKPTRFITRELVRRVMVDGENVDEEISSNVVAFNIYKDELYCARYDNAEYVIEIMDMDGSNVSEIYRTKLSETEKFKRFFVNDKYVVCETVSSNEITGKRRLLIIDKEKGLINSVTN